jgi:agmatine deiminase
MTLALTRRMPAEWEPHRATWISWPHEHNDFPGKIEVIAWVYTEIVRALAPYEHVEILCNNDAVKEQAESYLSKSGITSGFTLHLCPSDRSWLRDSAPTAVRTQKGDLEWIQWDFNAWAKYSNYLNDKKVPPYIQSVTKRDMIQAVRPDTNHSFVCEGGALETDGYGTLLTTEECLLSTTQERNHNLSREQYEEVFKEYLGITHTIWLDRSCEGDDTHGHIDDVARFVAPGRVVLAYESDPSDPNHAASRENLKRLNQARDARGNPLEVILLPMPHRRTYDGYVLPASYVNFYIANNIVLVPTFNDPRDSEVLQTIQRLFPERTVTGISCVDLILGLGTLHCLTQQEPAQS